MSQTVEALKKLLHWGLQGRLMGTRFLASKEVKIHPVAQAAVLEAKDGGQVTKRSRLWDLLKGPNVWPKVYDGRGIVMQSYKDHIDSVELEKIQRLHKKALEGEGSGLTVGGEGRAAIWAGTGVGLVKRVEGAGDIVESVWRGVKDVMRGLSNL